MYKLAFVEAERGPSLPISSSHTAVIPLMVSWCIFVTCCCSESISGERIEGERLCKVGECWYGGGRKSRNRWGSKFTKVCANVSTKSRTRGQAEASAWRSLHTREKQSRQSVCRHCGCAQGHVANCGCIAGAGFLTDCSSHGIFPSPFLGGVGKLFTVCLIDLRDLWYKRVVCTHQESQRQVSHMTHSRVNFSAVLSQARATLRPSDRIRASATLIAPHDTNGEPAHRGWGPSAGTTMTATLSRSSAPGSTGPSICPGRWSRSR
jgi:hypothetical protein